MKMVQQLNNETYGTCFDFNEWKMLAKSDPEAFEKRRSIVIDELIAKCVFNHRLQCLQWRIDMERRKYHHPLVSCMQLFNMMFNYMHAENGFINILKQFSDMTAGTATNQTTLKSAKILPFRQR
jgi:hypothetical protein